MTTAAKILIVDDEEGFLVSTARILEEEGYVCHCANGSTEGLTALAGDKFDLIIADIRMPGNLELGFFSKLKDEFPDLPLIVITGYPSIDTAIRGIQLKVWDYIVKPIDIGGFLKRIKICLAETRAQGS